MSKANGIFRLKGEQETYKCKLQTNALAALEDELGYGINTIAMSFTGGEFSLKDLRAIVWASLLWEDSDLTLDEAGEILDDVVEHHGWEGFVVEVGKALNTWLPDEDELDEADIKNAMTKD